MASSSRKSWNVQKKPSVGRPGKCPVSIWVGLSGSNSIRQSREGRPSHRSARIWSCSCWTLRWFEMVFFVMRPTNVVHHCNMSLASTQWDQQNPNWNLVTSVPNISGQSRSPRLESRPCTRPSHRRAIHPSHFAAVPSMKSPVLCVHCACSPKR